MVLYLIKIIFFYSGFQCVPFAFTNPSPAVQKKNETSSSSRPASAISRSGQRNRLSNVTKIDNIIANLESITVSNNSFFRKSDSEIADKQKTLTNRADSDNHLLLFDNGIDMTANSKV